MSFIQSQIFKYFHATLDIPLCTTTMFVFLILFFFFFFFHFIPHRAFSTSFSILSLHDHVSSLYDVDVIFCMHVVISKHHQRTLFSIYHFPILTVSIKPPFCGFHHRADSRFSHFDMKNNKGH